MASMIHQNGKSESGIKTGLMIGETSLRSLVGGAFVPVARGTSAPPRKRPPSNNMGGKPGGKQARGGGAYLGTLGLMAKLSIKGLGPVRFVGFVLYRRDTDVYLFRMRTAGKSGVWSAVKEPAKGYVFGSFEEAAQGKPDGEAGWEVLALYDGKKSALVMTV